MHDVEPYAIIVLIAAVALLAAVGSSRVSARIGVPAPAIFLVGASIAADLFPSLGSLSIMADQRIVTIALIVILFDGGMHIGWRRFRETAGAITWIGVAGTFVTAGGLALAAHGLFGFSWRTALLIGTALAPTDPAVVFSVLGRREISGRSGTLLEGESGANDPVGIALMISILGTSSGGWSAVGHGAFEFVLQMVVGGAFGLAGAYALLWLMRRVPMPNDALYALRTIAFALLTYGAATACHGSGFLAVFLTGILVGDARAPYKREIERFVGATSSLGEIVAFTVLGLSIPISDAFGHGRAWIGVGLAALMIFLIRPVLVGLLLAPIRLRIGERAFVLWSGLKGAVPILLGTYVLSEHVAGASRVYGVIFVVVLISVIVQGGLVPVLGRLWHVPMRVVEPEPWSLGMRFRDEPEGLRRFVVQAGSAADGSTIGDLPIGEDVWISMVSRHGRLLHVSGDTTLEPGDEVLALVGDEADPSSTFAP
ncbi:MAG TPA: cation:proton antiporter [Jatrophihabitantaceae bacterium]|nr:cation:proton antiporter [Jatrophihabitantaceae bacterium]